MTEAWIALALSLFHWVVGFRLPARPAAWIQVLGDLAIVTLLVYSSGGPDSVFTFLFLVVIGTAGFLLQRTGAVVTASIATVLYGSMVELVAYGALPIPAFAALSEWTGPRVRYNLAITVVGFLGVAILVGLVLFHALGIKPAAGMEEMKWDMGGAGAVIGAMHALAARKAKANLRKHGLDFPLIHGNAESVPFPDASFDLVVCLDVLEVFYERISVEPFREPPGSESSSKGSSRRRHSN